MPPMPIFSVRLFDDLAARFDAAAASQGGRSALLRRLMSEAAVPGPPAVAKPLAVAQVRVGFDAVTAGHVEREAAAMGMGRGSWVAALARRHAQARPTLSRREEIAVLAIQADVHRIGLNVNQIARTLTTAVLEGRVLDLDLSEVRAFQLELRGQMAAVRDAVAGNLAYWDVDGG